MNRSIEISRKVSLAYRKACRPLCKELGLPQTAFDILMFLGNNPAYKTASDIVEIRHIKANLVSVNVDRLVQDGYLVRNQVRGDPHIYVKCRSPSWGAWIEMHGLIRFGVVYLASLPLVGSVD